MNRIAELVGCVETDADMTDWMNGPLVAAIAVGLGLIYIVYLVFRGQEPAGAPRLTSPPNDVQRWAASHDLAIVQIQQLDAGARQSAGHTIVDPRISDEEVRELERRRSSRRYRVLLRNAAGEVQFATVALRDFGHDQSRDSGGDRDAASQLAVEVTWDGPALV